MQNNKIVIPAEMQGKDLNDVVDQAYQSLSPEERQVIDRNVDRLLNALKKRTTYGKVGMGVNGARELLVKMGWWMLHKKVHTEE